MSDPNKKARDEYNAERDASPYWTPPPPNKEDEKKEPSDQERTNDVARHAGIKLNNNDDDK